MAKASKNEFSFLGQSKNPYAEVVWRGHEIPGLPFEVEAPASWSPFAVQIAATKYFRGEKSIRQLIDRVVDPIAKSGLAQKYFKSQSEARAFGNELKFLCVHQMAAFNSPVWFNSGVYKRPQCSACFILRVEDSLERIFNLVKTEAMIFKYGSGAGANFSPIRGKNEPVSPAGQSSGLMAFLKVFDQGASATKSGGTTRRAAKMVSLDVDHPEILDFIRWKAHEEVKARHLLRAGYSGGLDGEAYQSVSGQNSNNSVRVTDRFLKAVEKKQEWWTRNRLDGKRAQKFLAADLWREIIEAAWCSADPGLQFHDTVNSWHTCPHEGAIRSSNPCSEYLFVDDSACNLASLNLVRFLKDDGSFDVRGFSRAAELILKAQDILVEYSSYPTERIARNSSRLRPLGLGFTNLGGLLMRLGLAYDSEEGRSWAAAVTALMGGVAYRTSARMAKKKGAFAAFKKNRDPMLKVISRHQKALSKIPEGAPQDLVDSAKACWDEALLLGKKFGFRNAQVTAIAPTGTISLLMDCETTGIEPEFSLVKTKSLVGGGEVRLVNQGVGPALARLGYDEREIEKLVQALYKFGALEKLGLKAGHLAVFDCAQPQKPGGRLLSPQAHLLMMSVVQPFISGAISKTVNLPAGTSADEIGRIYKKAWELGLKSIAIYRDGSKSVQPLVASCHICG